MERSDRVSYVLSVVAWRREGLHEKPKNSHRLPQEKKENIQDQFEKGNLFSYLQFLYSISLFTKQLSLFIQQLDLCNGILLQAAAGYKRIPDHSDNLASLKKRRKTFNVVPRKSTLNIHKLPKPRRSDITDGKSKTHNDENLSMR